MRKFFIQMLIIVLLVLLVNFLYVLMIGGSLRAYAVRYNRMGDRVKFLVLGDSHANRAWAMNADTVIYNFAYGSDNIGDMTSKFEYTAALNSLTGKKAVVLSFESHLISAYREVKNNNRLNDVLNQPYVSMAIVNLFPLIFDPNTEFDVKIFLMSLTRRNGAVEGSERVFKKRKAQARFKDQFPDGQGSVKLLSEYQELIDSIRSFGYDIIAIKYPVHPYFDSLVDNSTESTRLTRKMDSLANVNGLRILDFSDIIREPDLFLDQDHLNEKGSLVFMRAFQQHLGKRYDE